MKKKLIFPVLLPLVAAPTAWLLWPLKTDHYRLIWDEGEREEKKDFLASLDHARESDRLPNIVVILADDLGVNDVSFYGHGKVSTPNIDAIAQAGVAFSQAYCASPVCSPSRAALLTGRYPQKAGFQFQIHDRYLKNRLEYYGFRHLVKSHPWGPRDMEKVPRQEDIDRQGLPPSEITLAEMLRARGYATALIGKWHLGWDEQNLPCEFGFDYQYGFFDSNSLYAPEGTGGITDQKIEGDFTDKYMWKDGRKGPRDIHRNCEPVAEPEHLTDAITRESIAFISRSQERPFFLLAAYNAPHTPLQAPDRYVEMFRNEPDPIKRVYYAMIRQLDDNIGFLMEELDRRGLMDNTLIVFLSDNGGAEYTLTTDNAPLHGGKITDFEGGLRVPMCMRWDAKIPAGSLYKHPVIAMDIFATVANAAGCPLPTFRQPDGVDLLKYIGNDTLLPHMHLYWQRGHSKAIRSMDWKVIWNEESGDTLLFDLGKDPGETTDQYASHRELARQLIRIHADWSDRLPEPLWPPIVHFREDFNGRWIYFDN